MTFIAQPSFAFSRDSVGSCGPVLRETLVLREPEMKPTAGPVAELDLTFVTQLRRLI